MLISPQTPPHLQELLLLLLARDLAQDGLQCPTGGLAAQQPVGEWGSAHQPPTIPASRDPVWGEGWHSLVLRLRAGASGPRVDNGRSIVEDEVLTAELDVLSPCQVPLRPFCGEQGEDTGCIPTGQAGTPRTSPGPPSPPMPVPV